MSDEKQEPLTAEYIEELAKEYSKNKSSSSVFLEQHEKDFTYGFNSALRHIEVLNRKYDQQTKALREKLEKHKNTINKYVDLHIKDVEELTQVKEHNKQLAEATNKKTPVRESRTTKDNEHLFKPKSFKPKLETIIDYSFRFAEWASNKYYYNDVVWVCALSHKPVSKVKIYKEFLIENK